MVDGVLLTSASVKSHWLEVSDSMMIECPWAIWTSRARGGEFEVECLGGDGTAGGMREVLVMALGGECVRRRVEWTSEGISS